jgi:O-antigen ligase
MSALITLLALSLDLIWILYSWGGIPFLNRIYGFGAIGLIALFYLMFRSGTAPSTSLKPWTAFCIAAIPGYMAFQLVPLPVSILHFLSPARGALVASLLPIVPGISNSPISVNPPAELLALCAISSYILVFFIVRDVTFRFHRRPWITLLPLMIIGFLEAIDGMHQVWFVAPDHRSSGTFTNWDHFAGFLEIMLPLSLVYGLASLRTGSRKPLRSSIIACAIWSFSVLTFAAIVYSLSRTGFVVTLLILFVVAALCLQTVRLSRSGKVASLASLGLVTVALFFIIPTTQLIDRFAGLTTSTNTIRDARPVLWKETCSLIAEFPVFGVGSGGYESTFLKYQNIAGAGRVEFAHNDYLQYLAEFGFVGYLILLAALTGVLIPLFAGLKNNLNSDRRMIAIGCTASFLAIALHSIVDFNSQLPATAVSIAWILGVGSANGVIQSPSLHDRINL